MLPVGCEKPAGVQHIHLCRETSWDSMHLGMAEPAPAAPRASKHIPGWGRSEQQHPRDVASVHRPTPCMAPLQPSCPSPKVKTQKGIMGQHRWLLGASSQEDIKMRSLLLYFLCTGWWFPSLFTELAPFEAKTFHEVSIIPLHPALTSRAAHHPACPKSFAWCHLLFPPILPLD